MAGLNNKTMSALNMTALTDMFEELDKRIAESNKRWDCFMDTFKNYQSIISIPGSDKSMPPPVMTAEKRRKMQMYRKQAQITEVRIKSRIRERDLMNKVQCALDEVREFHITATSDSSFTETTNDSYITTTDSLTDSQPTAVENLSITQPKSSSHTGGQVKVFNRLLPDLPKFRHDDVAPRRKRTTSDGDSKELNTLSHTKPAHHSSQPNLSGPRQRYREEKNRAMQEKRTGTPNPAPDLHHDPRPGSTPPAIQQDDLQHTSVPNKAKNSGYTSPRKKVNRSKSNVHELTTPTKKHSPEKTTPKRSQSMKQTSPKKMLQEYTAPTMEVLQENATPTLRFIEEKSTHKNTILQKSTTPTKRSVLENTISKNRIAQESKTPIKRFVQDPTTPTKRIIQESTTPTKRIIQESTTPSRLQSPHPASPLKVTVMTVTTAQKNSPVKRTTTPKPTDLINQSDLKSVLDKLSPSDDYLTFQWLDDKVSRGETTVTTVEEWFQNAPDSVKQRLSSLLDSSSRDDKITPNTSPRQVDISPVHLCNSVDDTLRSSSPISEIEMSPRMEVEEPNMTIINKQIKNQYLTINTANTTLKNSPSISLMSPTVNSEHPIPEVSQQMPQLSQSSITHSSTPITKKLLKKQADRRHHDLIESINLSDSESPIDDTASRRQNVSMLSYTIDEPSQALIDSTLHENSSISSSTKKRRSRIPTPSEDKMRTTKHVARSKSEVTIKRTLSDRIEIDRSKTPGPKHRLLMRVLDSSGLGRNLTPTPPERPKSAQSTQPSAKSRYRKKDAKQTIHEETSERGKYKKKKTVPRSKSMRYVEQEKAVSENSAVSRSKSLKQRRENNTEETCQSQAKSVAFDTLMKARKHLYLLKQKVAEKKLSPRDQTRNTRPTTAPPSKRDNSVKTTSQPKPTVVMRTPSKKTRSEQSISTSATDKENLVREKLASHVRSLLRERPISSVKSDDNSEHSENSQFGGILSVSHKVNKPLDKESQAMKNKSTEHKVSPKLGSCKLAALIKGHLCRRLMKSYKVQSIIKTIKDCKSLLPTPVQQIESKTSLGEVNFQERLNEQMQAAKDDLHDIFFVLSTSRKVAFIKQSEMIAARALNKVHRSSSHKEVSRRHSKRNLNRQYNSLKHSASLSSTIKKSVLVPTVSKTSPMKGHSMALMV